MSTNEEKKFHDLRSKFQQELEDNEKTIENLVARSQYLQKLLNGEAVFETVETPAPKAKSEATRPPVRTAKVDQMVSDVRLLESLVKFLKTHGGKKRAEIVGEWAPKGVGGSDLDRIFKRGRRNGYITVVGQNRAATYFATDEKQ